MTPVDFSYPALLDVDAQAGFYDARQAGLGGRFRAAVADAVSRIAAQPGIGHPVGRPGFRRWAVAGFPFSLVYLVRAGAVEVYAVPHHKQSRRSWLRRLP